jgi:LytS/YehU family sensor histidine kinase
MISLVCFLACFHFYNKGVDWIIMNAPVLSVELRNEALKSFNRDSVPSFGINYMILEFLCVIALAYFVRSAKQDEQMQQLKEQQLMSELSYLKAQLHPHFFFNTLNNIYSLALKQSPDTAPVVAKLANMMQYILYESEQSTVPLSRDIAFLSDYVNVEQIRYNSSASISFDIQLDEKETYIQPLLLLPFVENAFKHGLEEEPGKGFISIVICRDEEELTLQVINSKPLNRRLKKGLGLENVHKRLNLLYPGRHHLAITENEKLYRVNLTLENK